MPTIDERIAELKNLIAEWSRELAVLEGQGGEVARFMKATGESFPQSVAARDAAQIIDLWEKFKGTKPNQPAGGSPRG